MSRQTNLEYGYVRSVATYLQMKNLERIRQDGDTLVKVIRVEKGRDVKATLNRMCLVKLWVVDFNLG